MFLEYSKVDRTCDKLDISKEHCNCQEYTILDQKEIENDEIINTIANFAVDSINKKINLHNVEMFCETVSLRKIKAAKKLPVFNEIWQDTKLKLQIEIEHSSNAIFDVFGWLAPHKDFQKNSQIDPKNGLFPIKEATVIHQNNAYLINFQLREVTRYNKPDDLCNEISKTLDIDEGFCICKQTETDYMNSNEKARNKINTIKNKFDLIIGEIGKDCIYTCNYIDKECKPWAFELFNSVTKLKEP